MTLVDLGVTIGADASLKAATAAIVDHRDGTHLAMERLIARKGIERHGN
jgi:hypothetical protein